MSALLLVAMTVIQVISTSHADSETKLVMLRLSVDGEQLLVETTPLKPGFTLRTTEIHDDGRLTAPSVRLTVSKRSSRKSERRLLWSRDFSGAGGGSGLSVLDAKLVKNDRFVIVYLHETSAYADVIDPNITGGTLLPSRTRVDSDGKTPLRWEGAELIRGDETSGESISHAWIEGAPESEDLAVTLSGKTHIRFQLKVVDPDWEWERMTPPRSRDQWRYRNPYATTEPSFEFTK